MNLRALAEKHGVRAIGLEQMMRELDFLPSVKKDCEAYEKRFPDGSPARYNGEPVTVVRMLYDPLHFPFYQVVFVRAGGGMRLLGRIGNGVRWV